MLKRFGVPIGDGLDLKIERRGAPPLGGGEVLLQIPIVPNTLSVSLCCSGFAHVLPGSCIRL